MVTSTNRLHANRLQRRKDRWGYLFIMPNLIGFLIFMFIPIVMSLYYSLTNYDVISEARFIGLRNYMKLFQDRQFIKALRNTLWYTLLTVPMGVILALLTAVLLNRPMKGIGLVRTLVFIPVITSMVAVSLVWQMLYDDNSGIFNILLKAVGLPGLHWLTDTNTAMISIAIMSIWKGLGYNMTIFLAGLQGVPHDLYEAARIDGANGRQMFFRITLPMITPTTYFVVLMQIIGSLQVFDQVYIMTNGGPVNSTSTVAFFLYQYGFKFYKMGYACAAAYVLFMLVLILSIIQNRGAKHFAPMSL